MACMNFYNPILFTINENRRCQIKSIRYKTHYLIALIMLGIQPKLFTALSALVFLGACATQANHYDPLEPVNRLTFAFNDKLDRYAVKPITTVYVNHTPGPIQNGISNFVGNIGGVSSTIGNMMEGEVKNTAKDIARIVINTVFGMFGLVDWATDLGLPRQNRSIGRALGQWGVGSGPYLVLPLLGITTLRDSTDIAFSWAAGVPHHFTHKGQNAYAIVGGIEMRASLLSYEEAMASQLIFDRYTYIRDSFLQKQYNDVYYGSPTTPLLLGIPDPGDIPDDANTDFSKDAVDPNENSSPRQTH